MEYPPCVSLTFSNTFFKILFRNYLYRRGCWLEVCHRSHSLLITSFFNFSKKCLAMSLNIVKSLRCFVSRLVEIGNWFWRSFLQILIPILLNWAGFINWINLNHSHAWGYFFVTTHYILKYRSFGSISAVENIILKVRVLMRKNVSFNKHDIKQELIW